MSNMSFRKKSWIKSTSFFNTLRKTRFIEKKICNKYFGNKTCSSQLQVIINHFIVYLRNNKQGIFFSSKTLIGHKLKNYSGFKLPKLTPDQTQSTVIRSYNC